VVSPPTSSQNNARVLANPSNISVGIWEDVVRKTAFGKTLFVKNLKLPIMHLNKSVFVFNLNKKINNPLVYI